LLTQIIEDAAAGPELIVVETARLYLDQIEALSSRIASLEKALRLEAKRSENSARLMSMPGMGPIIAMAIEAFAPTMTTFRKGEILQPGSAWSQNSIRAVESRCSAERQRWGSATSDGF
jgi:transposase